MEIAIGLPAMVPGIDGPTLLEWARRAEARGFASVCVEERLVWDGYEVLIAATAALAVTERLRVISAVLLAPLRTNAAEFAKQVATIDRFSGGRLVLGLGVGSRQDDFDVAGVDLHARGRLTDALLDRSLEFWRGDQADFGPRPATPGGPPMLFGGSATATFRRIARCGVGWICPTSHLTDRLDAGRPALERAWALAGREGRPLIYARAPRFALGPNGQAAVDGYVRAYNAFRGDAAGRAETSLLTPAAIADQVARFEAAGVDVLLLGPADTDPDEVDRLADAIGDRYLFANAQRSA
jgi:alkanesulfonate monooxygenase SsuD/methylene tetrahydromethanopterin reductase-like flavin-dependent oxidoreductase (luciferase family)